MPHVVIMGPGMPPDDICRRLGRWGMTTAQVGPWVGPALPTVLDCDAVLWFGDAPSAPAEAGRLPAAPVLLVADGDPRNSSWPGLSAARAETDALRRCLEACFAKARALRCRDDADPLRLGYRDFLGHELRSPLTAIRTALEEIAACTDEAGPLPDIALRNVERLQRVLEWSQDLLALTEAPDLTAGTALQALAESAPWLETERDAPRLLTSA